MSETRLKAAITRALRERGAWVYKVHGGPLGSAGVPDLLVCYKGRFVAVEVKIPSGRVSPRQRLVIREIVAAGGEAIVAWSVAEALAIITAA